jgi:mannitol-1-phosphate 5-dehydrogenase
MAPFFKVGFGFLAGWPIVTPRDTLYPDAMRKKAVFVGAGNIGRGFLGQVLTEGGFEVVFIDVDQDLVDSLNAAGSYPLCLLSDAGETELTIAPIRAVHALSAQAAAEIAGADLLGTSVGAAALKSVAPVLAAGLRARWEAGNRTALDVLVCENLWQAHVYLRGLVEAGLSPDERARLGATVGFVETSIGRMVPVPSAETRRGNALRVCAEPYAELPVDRQGFKGTIPALPGLVATSPFRFIVERKLFVHNLGHAVAAYLGAALGYAWIWQSAADPALREITLQAMRQSARALAAEHREDLAALEAHAQDLLARFANRGLGDTTERVCKDPLRKLAPHDRLLGALALCRTHGLDSSWIEVGIAAALQFHQVEGSPSPVEAVLTSHCRLDAGSPEHQRILALTQVFHATARDRLLEALHASVRSRILYQGTL